MDKVPVMRIKGNPLWFRALAVGLIALTGVGFAAAQAPAEADAPAEEAEVEVDAESLAMAQALEAMGWKRDGVGELGDWAQVPIPSGYRFTGKSGTKQFLEFTENIPGGGELGIIAPEEFDWWVLFEFDESGYVKDEDKDSLDAAAMLKSMQEGQEMANKQREQLGMGPLFVDRWAREPNYNEATNNLEWATVLVDGEGNENVNYNTRLLGRRGVMQVTLICDESQLPTVLGDFQKMVGNFGYKDGQSYAEYKEGDKVAKYGLAALILGGGAAVAAKTGLFAVIGKFFKYIIAGFVAIGLAIKRLFTGRQDS